MTPLVIGLAAVIVVILVAVAVGLRFVRHDERADLAERPAERGGARSRKDPDRRSNGQRPLPDRIPARQDRSGRQRRSDRGHDEPASPREARGRAAADRRQDDWRHAGAARAQAAPGGIGGRDEPAFARQHQDELPQLRARQVRGRRDDAADWPSTEWDSLSDADYWKEVASDRPLTTTARTAQPQSGQGRRGAGLPPASAAAPAAAPQPADTAYGRGSLPVPVADHGHGLSRPAAAGPAGYSRDLPYVAGPATYSPDLLAAPTAGLARGTGRPEPGRPDLARRGHPGTTADPGQPGTPLRPRPVVPVPVPVPDDNDPLTSPSFPKVATSDSRSYRNGRSAGTARGPDAYGATADQFGGYSAPAPGPAAAGNANGYNGYHGVEPDIGQAATAAYSYRRAPQPAVPQPAVPPPAVPPPAVPPPSGNPYGSYVSSDLPGYLDNPAPAYHRAGPEPGYESYPAGAGNGRAASPYLYGLPVVNAAPPGDNWKSSWYPDAPASSAAAVLPANPVPPASPAPPAQPGPRAAYRTPEYTNGDGQYGSAGYAPGSYPDGRDDYGRQQRR